MKQNLIGKVDFAKSLLTFSFELLVTGIGFFLALYFNSEIENSKEKEIFSNIKKSLSAEIEQNLYVVDSSYRPFIHGVMFTELSTITSSKQLSNDIFLKYCTSDLLIKLQKYVRLCDLCNKLCFQLRDFRIKGETNIFDEALERSMTITMEATEQTMKQLQVELNSK